MLIALYKNARTTPAIHAEMACSTESAGAQVRRQRSDRLQVKETPLGA